MSELKQKLQAIAPKVFEKTPVLFAYLYGSHAKGLSHPFSDLDIGIYVENLDKSSCLDLELSLALLIDEEFNHTVQAEVRQISGMRAQGNRKPEAQSQNTAIRIHATLHIVPQSTPATLGPPCSAVSTALRWSVMTPAVMSFQDCGAYLGDPRRIPAAPRMSPACVRAVQGL